jgi:hypothetical protein
MTNDEIDALCAGIERELCHLPGEEPCGCLLCSKIYPAIPTLRQLQAENARLTALIDVTAQHWLDLQSAHPIQWEGGIDEAMRAACETIASLKAAERAAYKRGQEDMRERAADFIGSTDDFIQCCGATEAILALPIKETPDET